MKVVSRLGDLMQRLRVSDSRLERDTGINREHIRKIREGTFQSISRREIQILWSWGQQRDKDFALFELVRHPIWASFEKGEATILRGKGDQINAVILDARVEHMLSAFLSRLKCRVAVKMQPDLNSAAQVRELMTTHNCIFIGSPKSNPAVSMAVGALWNFDANDVKARPQAPFWFSWGESASGQRPNALSELARGLASTGIYVNNGTKAPLLLGVNWRPLDDYLEWSGTAWDAGVLVVTRQPLGTRRDVTTMIIAGYTGMGTVELAQDVINDSVDISPNELAAGRPVLRILRFPYRKEPGENREAKTKGRTWWKGPSTDSAPLSRPAARRSRQSR